MKEKIIAFFSRIKARWDAKENKLGKWLKNIFAPTTFALAAVGHLTNSPEILAVQQWIDPIVFKIMAGCALASAIIGKFTVAKE
jgi:hypothetical protein